MERYRILPIGLVIAAVVIATVPVAAQAAKQPPPTIQEGKPIIQTLRSVPFASGRERPKGLKAVEFLPSDQMSLKDRELKANAESSIAERAGFQDLQFNEGKWNYQQIVCSALPNHLFLRFTRNNGIGDQSVFSVSIPRKGGQVRIIPILRRSYSLWSPAPINALTISDFNRIRREDGAGRNSDWYGTGLCYAALAGADPEVRPLKQDSISGLPTTGMAELQVPVEGGAVIRFIDQASRPKLTLWTMIFNTEGKLLKVKHVPAVAYKEWEVPATANPPLTYRPIEVKGPTQAASRGFQ